MSRFVPEVYAIDFGTTNSLLAAANSEEVCRPIELDPGASEPTILRSVLYFPDADLCFYGQQALVEYVARDMQGRLMRSIKKHLPSRAFVGTFVDERPMNLEDLIGALLGEMRRRADRHFDTQVTHVVLGRPARFARDIADDRFAESRLRRAAEIGGFTDITFCPEPIAAAREFRSTLQEAQLVLVADFGGGTSDFTVLRMHGGEYSQQDVLAIGGVSVAGDLFDASLMRHQVSPFFGSQVQYKVPMGSNVLRMPPALMEKLCSPADASLLRERDAMTFLRNVRGWSLGPQDEQSMDNLLCFVEDRLGFSVFEAIEQTKRTLSAEANADFEFDYPGISIRHRIARARFESGATAQTKAILDTLDETVDQAGVTHADIDIVCCTGGTARVPMVAQGLEHRFGKPKLRQFRHFHSVIQGLAEHARAIAQGA